MGGLGLSVLIVTHDAASEIGPCLAYLTGSEIGRSCEIVVVDNGSRDGTGQIVAGRWPEVHLVAGRRGHGVAGGTALAFAASRGRYLLLLAPNVLLIDPGTVAGLIEGLDARPEAGAVGLRLVADGGAGAAPGRLAAAVRSLGIGPRGAATVGGASEACLMIRREAACPAGASPLFLGGGTWPARLRGAGWGVEVLPRLEAIQLGRSVSALPARVRRERRSGTAQACTVTEISERRRAP